MALELHLLRDYLSRFSIDLSQIQAEQFNEYYELLIEKNKVMNLTTIIDPLEVEVKHFIDSMTLLELALPQSGTRILDLGTGAGFPGIPIKIIFPDIEITLLDSLNKRIVFLNEVIEKLALDKVKTRHGRAEEMAQSDEFRESYDLVVSRAVANLSTLCEYCIPFVKVHGSFIAYKADRSEAELSQAKNAIELLGANINKTIFLELPGKNNEKRCLIDIKKIRHTAKRFPRKAGIPSKDPL